LVHVHIRIRRSLLFVLGVFLAVALVPRRAEAYAWMIGHGYAGCATCHLDPSGAGLLNEFGREEAADTLRSHYGSDPPPVEPFFGLWKNPDWLLTGGSFRDGLFFMKAGSAPYAQQNILMQADLRLGIDAGRWRAAGSLGVLANGNFPASVVTSDSASLIAREYWLGYTFANDTVLLRAGRINVPFGIRSIEHTLFVRAATQTDINDTQEHGVALAARGGGFRGELMAIAGNYQESPDAYRQRGYSGYLEWNPIGRYAVGVSSLVTYVKQDESHAGSANLRQAHGLTLRAAPIDRLVLLGEADYVGEGLSGQPHWNGLATMLQADFEPWQGLHFIGTGETYGSGEPGTDTSWSLWGSVAWFFLSHVDIRFDYVHQSLSTPPPEGRIPIETYLLQLHVFL
jgi:hypothetical protein